MLSPGYIPCCSLTDISHDWGSQVCNEAARQRPDLFDGVIATAIPVSDLEVPKQDVMTAECVSIAVPSIFRTVYPSISPSVAATKARVQCIPRTEYDKCDSRVE